MQYQIIPLEIGSIVEREIFQKDNMEIKCGFVWKLGSLLTKYKPTFLKKYQPELGICIADIKGASISNTYNAEKVIYFSETVPEEMEEELTDIFYGISRKFSGTYQDIYQDLEWKLVSSESFIFGQLEVKELKDPYSSYK
ncbi:MAG: hypothetical protein B7Y05_05390 [Polynucleobacter sp. 24-46-87]|jgi:hypothetical protein|nr:MAG: hypothetical protein B7Y55_00170 [Polynucleobacter sp. 35-46-207]OYZ39046.1 MAG: hypothetical protein B7Y22_00185 [Polynucleobacter sp. 16-46-70]OZA15094.1 MAG: hypothetical protein B7Y05_05390 [Polynucleobacter sp. 24-46-87]OZA42100.1 MAG: hypothetical protein B7X83_00255 [Polynucleobacter sp. 17-46-58]OZB49657.1 MAG: hypothetical protein B7X60_00480 [Polynucleobacter sp. 39-45-136]HQR83376.1 hypothetical protein [Polynucleobacter sp.]